MIALKTWNLPIRMEKSLEPFFPELIGENGFSHPLNHTARSGNVASCMYPPCLPA